MKCPSREGVEGATKEKKGKKKIKKKITNRKIWHLLNHSDNFSTVFTQSSKNKLSETDYTHMPLARQQGCPAASETKHEEARARGNHHQCDSVGARAAFSPASRSGSSGRKRDASLLPPARTRLREGWLLRPPQMRSPARTTDR